MAKEIRERRGRGTDLKADRAAKRRLRKAEEQERDVKNEYLFQFNRVLGHIFDGRPTPEEVEYVARNIKKHETVTNRFGVNAVDRNGEEKQIEVAATIVEFAR